MTSFVYVCSVEDKNSADGWKKTGYKGLPAWIAGAYLKFCVGGHIISIKGEQNDRQHQSLQAPAA